MVSAMQRAPRRLLCALLLPLAAAVMAAACGGSDRPVVFSDLNWPSAQIQSRIAGFIVEHGYGFEVEYLPGDTVTLWEEMLDNNTDITMETWLPNL